MSNKITKNVIAIERGKRVRFLRMHVAGMTGEEFAKYCGGLARGTITNWETGKGKTGLTAKGAKQIVHAMKGIGITCGVDWLLEGSGDIPKIFDQRQLSRLHYPLPIANPPACIEEPGFKEADSFLEEIACFKKRYPTHLLCTLHSENMSPIYHTHDCVGGPCLSSDQYELIKGRICIVLLDNNQLFVRRAQVESVETNMMNFYIINFEIPGEDAPLIRASINSIVAMAPITHLWRHPPNFF